MKLRPKVLVIDDSETVLERVRAALEPICDVLTTSQIVGNAKHLSTCDVVIIDYHMPGFNGDTVLQSMRSVTQGAGRRCQFFLYTSDRSVEARYAELGFDGVFLDKGNVVSLARQMQSVLRRAEISSKKSSKAV